LGKSRYIRAVADGEHSRDIVPETTHRSKCAKTSMASRNTDEAYFWQTRRNALLPLSRPVHRKALCHNGSHQQLRCWEAPCTDGFLTLDVPRRPSLCSPSLHWRMSALPPRSTSLCVYGASSPHPVDRCVDSSMSVAKARLEYKSWESPRRLAEL